jgi:DNA-binding XRE family transcriptional regulator
MIKNEVEYQVSQEWVLKFQKSIAAMEQDEERKKNDWEQWELNRSALQSHLEKLHQEITEYEQLINCDKKQPIKIQVKNLNKLPDVLIKARIAAKMSQKELANILGIEEERIKECEKKDYQCASFLEILDVSEALGVEFKNASVEVDFEEIEEFKKVAQKWHEKQQAKKNIKTAISPNEIKKEIV